MLTRGGGQAVQGGLSCPNMGIFSLEVYKFYFSKSEMLTSNGQLVYMLTRGGGQAVQGGLSGPPPRISDNPQTLTKLNSGCKYHSLTKVMFISHTTKYSKIMN